MDRKAFSSLEKIHRIYWHHTFRSISELILLVITFVLLGVHLLIGLDALFSLSDTAINSVVILIGIATIYLLGQHMSRWAEGGFRIQTFFHRWEQSHDEVANRASMLVYAEQNEQEIERLGYSAELISADDSWLDRFIDRYLKQVRAFPSTAAFAIFAAVVFSSCSLVFFASDFLQEHAERIANALWIQDTGRDLPQITVTDRMEVERGKPVELTAQFSQNHLPEEPYIHIKSRSGWRTISAQADGDSIVFTIPSVRDRLAYYMSDGASISNLGEVIPLDPPSVTESRFMIYPPEYTGRPETVVSPMRPISVPVGTRVVFSAQSNIELASASIRLGNDHRKAEVNGQTVVGAFAVTNDSELSLKMEDRRGLSGTTPSYAIVSVPDATPRVEILKPKINAKVPSSMKQTVQAKVTDDYRLEHVVAYHWLNQNEDAKQLSQLWNYSPQAAKTTGSSTEFFVTFEWDLEQMKMFPGDEMSFFVEAWDNDGIHGSKNGRSDVHIIRYPSLSDLLADLDDTEEQHVENLENLVEDQHNIAEEVKETVEDISEKVNGEEYNKDDPESLWTEKKKLESLKERQEQLVEQAKKMEEELQAYEDSVDKNMNEEQQQEQGFTPETVEKMARIRELLDDLVTDDSQQMLKNIEDTIEQMSKQVDDKQLQDMQFSVEDFEQQLDRTLSMLENTYQGRQMEGLREMAQELAQRQDHLQRQVDELMAEEQALDQQEAQLNQEIEQQQAQNAQAQNAESPQGQQDNQQQNGDRQNAGQNQNQGNPDEQKADAGQQDQSLTPEQQAKKEELERKREELENRKKLLEERQQKAQEDANQLMESMKEMEDSTSESNPSVSKQLQNMRQQAEKKGLLQEMSQAVQMMRQNRMQQAQMHQQNAQQQLQDMANQMQQQMANMGMQNLQQDSKELVRLVERGLFLSDQLETLCQVDDREIDAQRAIRRAQAFDRETKRIALKWQGLAQTNPFMSRKVDELLGRSSKNLDKAVSASQGLKWIAYHESRQALKALNQALYQMLQDSNNMQQQMQQSGMDDMQQQMQQMISQQQSLNQMIQQMRQMGEQGQEMLEKLQQMAQRQAQIRRQIEKMMQKYRNAQQLKNQLQGIYEEMREVEKLLDSGENNEEVEKRQKRIMTRMLEAGTFQEEDEFGKKRQEEVAKSGLDAESPAGPASVQMEEKIRSAATSPDTDTIPAQYRDAVKDFYIRLSETVAK